MLALTLMSFTIGADLGFVLAKGVFFSLFSIFTVLPALVLILTRRWKKPESTRLCPSSKGCRV